MVLMFWLRAKDMNEAINKASDKIVSQIDVAQVQADLIEDLKNRLHKSIMERMGFDHNFYFRDSEWRLQEMLNNRMKEHANILADKAVDIHSAKVLAALDSKEIQKLVEKGIKEKVKETLK